LIDLLFPNHAEALQAVFSFSTLLHGFWHHSILFIFVPVFCLCGRFDFQQLPSLYFQTSSTVTQRSVSVSRTSNNDADINAGKNLKKKNKKRDQTEKNPFIATLTSVKKDMGIHDITPEEFWSRLRNVSKFYNLEVCYTLFSFFSSYF
jgi:hypothetical protein